MLIKLSRYTPRQNQSSRAIAVGVGYFRFRQLFIPAALITVEPGSIAKLNLKY